MTDTPVLAIPGWSCPPALMEELASGISARASTLGINDLYAPESDSLMDYAGALGAHLTEPSVLVGWSMGGMIALEAAIRYPERIQALILINSTSCFVANDDYAEGVPAIQLRAMIQQMQQDANSVLTNFHAVMPDSARQTSLAYASELPPDQLIHDLLWLEQFDQRAGLSRVRCPVQIFSNPADPIIPPSASEYLAEALPESTLTPLNSPGHGGWIDEVPAILNHLSFSTLFA